MKETDKRFSKISDLLPGAALIKISTDTLINILSTSFNRIIIITIIITMTIIIVMIIMKLLSETEVSIKIYY